MLTIKNRRGRSLRPFRTSRPAEQRIKQVKRDVVEATMLLSRIVDPPTYKASTVYNRTVRVSAVLSADNKTFAITPTTVATALGFDPTNVRISLRFQSFKVWADPASSLTVIVSEAQVPSSNSTATFTDYGIAGSTRPSVHAQFSRAIREYWTTTNSAQTFLQITSSPFGLVIVDVLVAFRITSATVN